jgi:hypothetical protein
MNDGQPVWRCYTGGPHNWITQLRGIRADIRCCETPSASKTSDCVRAVLTVQALNREDKKVYGR